MEIALKKFRILKVLRIGSGPMIVFGLQKMIEGGKQLFDVNGGCHYTIVRSVN